jgi:hypothetical protein
MDRLKKIRALKQTLQDDLAGAGAADVQSESVQSEGDGAIYISSPLAGVASPGGARVARARHRSC